MRANDFVQFPTLVTPVMADLAVEGTVEEPKGRNVEHEATSGPKQPEQRAQGLVIIPDVFQHVHHHDAVELLLGFSGHESKSVMVTSGDLWSARVASLWIAAIVRSQSLAAVSRAAT